MSKKHYTWEEKIDNLAQLAKIVGTYLDVEIEDPGSDGHKETREKLKDTYEEFCQWRHDEPYVVDEIKAMLLRWDNVDECMSMLFTSINLVMPKEATFGPVGLASQMKIKATAKEDYRKLSEAIAALRKPGSTTKECEQ